MSSLRSGVVFAVSLFLMWLHSADASKASTTMIPNGDYRAQAPGTFRRLIVAAPKDPMYDVWRVTEKGSVEHLTFLLSTAAGIPMESDRLRVKTPSGHDCGEASLNLYREDGTVVAGIVLFSYQGLVQPMSSGGRALGKADAVDDLAFVQALKQQASEPKFYKFLGVQFRTVLNNDVPVCK